MTILRSIAMAFSLFSRIPMPHVKWEAGSMRYTMAAFPLVGVVIGVAIGVWMALCSALEAHAFVEAVGITVIPVLITGGIHLDGWCDVIDAQASHAEPARKRAIMKDPHSGAFAVVGLACYMLVYVACALQLVSIFANTYVTLALLLALIHILTRAGSGIATTLFPAARDDGMGAMEHASAHTMPVVIVLGIVCALCIAASIFLWPVAGIVCALCWAGSLAALKRFSQREFGGMNGDVAGFYLQMTELVLVGALVLVVLIDPLVL